MGLPTGGGEGAGDKEPSDVRILIDYMCKFGHIGQPGALLLDVECRLCSA